MTHYQATSLLLQTFRTAPVCATSDTNIECQMLAPRFE